MNLSKLLDSNCEKFGEYVSIIWLPDPNREIKITNIDMLREVNRLGSALLSLGVKRGDKISVLLPNSPEVIATYRAAWRIGAVAVPIIFLLSEREVRYILENSESVAIVTHSEFYEKVSNAAKGLDNLKNIILIDKPQEGAHYYHDLIEKSRDEVDPVDTADDEMAVVLYTAGTTGKPKGVMLSHWNLYSNAKSSFKQSYFPDVEDVRSKTSLFVLPLCHSFGLTVCNLSAFVGNMGVMVPKFDPNVVLGAIEKYKVKTMAGVPAMYSYFLVAPEADKYDLSSMESWASGSAPLSVNVIKNFEKKFGGTIYEGYGLSEASPVVAVHMRNRPTKPGSVGIPIPGVEVKILDVKGHELGTNQIGELVVRGENVMQGYYKMPEKTADVIRNGWLHTGDMAHIDEDGYLFISERKDDMIIRGGENIYPRELEEVLWSHPDILEVAVVGIPDPIMGEEAVAVVVLHKQRTITEQEVIEFCKGKIAKFKLPKAVVFMDSLPRSSIGKILKKNLRKDVLDLL
jgi:long-chain acyl-CoA synthetase